MIGRYNFLPGPSVLPDSVRARILDDLPNWQDSGFSVMEISHRSERFDRLAQQCEARLRRLLGVGEDYVVLFMQGGASHQFGLIPMNLSDTDQSLSYVVTGHWGRKAATEAARLREVRRVTPDLAAGEWILSETEQSAHASARCLHLTDNETIEGVRLPEQGIPTHDCLISDMSSSLFSRPLQIDPYAMIYAGAQKNAGIAGVTLVIMRRDLLERCPQRLPTTMNYRDIAAASSMHNTPATFSWYVCDLVLEWLEEQGGLQAQQARNTAKASALYQAIDQSSLFSNPVPVPWRSDMNVIFHLPDDSLTASFLARAESEGLIGLKGHRIAGGCRASLYNAMSLDGVNALIGLMQEFERSQS